MESFKKRQMTMWALFGLPEAAKRRNRRRAYDASGSEIGRPPDGLGYEKGPEIAPGREGRQRGSNGFGR